MLDSQDSDLRVSDITCLGTLISHVHALSYCTTWNTVINNASFDILRDYDDCKLQSGRQEHKQGRDVPKESIQKHKRAQSCYAKDTSDRDRPVAMLNAKATDVERMGPRCIAVQIKLPIPTSCAELICQLVDGSQWKGKARSRGLETMVKPHCG